MLDEQGHLLPHAWLAGDDEMGRTTAFRRDLNDRNEQYLLAVPSNTAIRDLEATPPTYGSHGSNPKTPFVQAHQWRDEVAPDQWTRIKVRDAEIHRHRERTEFDRALARRLRILAVRASRIKR